MNAEKVEEAIRRMNSLGKSGREFIFIIDFEMENPEVLLPDEAAGRGIFYDIEGFTNSAGQVRKRGKPGLFEKYPLEYEEYCISYEIVRENILCGNTYLLNLTFPTLIRTDFTLGNFFYCSSARYRLLYRDKFVLFSPESFIRISGNRISSYPMKGTARVDSSSSSRTLEKLMGDGKELAEHITIVDLIRNDLNMVAGNVCVKRFRYPETVMTSGCEIIQTSSEITGDLGAGWKGQLGDIIFKLLPAGSVTGAPKKKTVEIIRKAEKTGRGYYTGVFGCFDGSSVNSAVMIRFIEKKCGSLYYRSGGGITVYSEPEKEYREMADKVYAAVV